MADNRELIDALTTADVLARMQPNFSPWGGTTPGGFFRGLGGVANAVVEPARNIMNQGPRMLSSGGYDPGEDAFKGALTAITGGMPFAQAGAVGSAGGRIPNPIRAYHGSPHDFDKFDASKIGTGEGAQAYGHGLYFADKEGVARSYRDNLSEMTVGGKPYNEMDASHQAATELHFAGGDRARAIQALRDKAERFKLEDPGLAQNLRVAAIKLERNQPLPEVGNAGRMYEVALHAPPEAFLDWGVAPGEQSPFVKAALAKTGIPVEPPKLDFKQVGPNEWQSGEWHIHREKSGDYFWEKRAGADSKFAQRGMSTLEGAVDDIGWNSPAAVPSSGSAAYKQLMGDFDPEFGITHSQGGRKASDALREAGIPGIRYKDQLSRGTEGGTSNYVVFPGNESLIEILRKYGLLAPVAAPAISNALGGSDQ